MLICLTLPPRGQLPQVQPQCVILHCHSIRQPLEASLRRLDPAGQQIHLTPMIQLCPVTRLLTLAQLRLMTHNRPIRQIPPKT